MKTSRIKNGIRLEAAEDFFDMEIVTQLALLNQILGRTGTVVTTRARVLAVMEFSDAHDIADYTCESFDRTCRFIFTAPKGCYNVDDYLVVGGRINTILHPIIPYDEPAVWIDRYLTDPDKVLRMHIIDTNERYPITRLNYSNGIKYAKEDLLSLTLTGAEHDSTE